MLRERKRKGDGARKSAQEIKRRDTTGRKRERKREQGLGLEKSSQLRCYIIQIADP